MGFQTEIKNIGNMLAKQVKASDKTNDARRVFAVTLQDSGLTSITLKLHSKLK